VEGDAALSAAEGSAPLTDTVAPAAGGIDIDVLAGLQSRREQQPQTRTLTSPFQSEEGSVSVADSASPAADGVDIDESVRLQAIREQQPQAVRLPSQLRAVDAQTTAANAVAANPFLALFPELRDTYAPRWLRTGTRVTYHVQSASFIQDPDSPDPSGGGYLQYDLVAFDRKEVVSSSKFYLVNVLNGVVTPSTVAPSYGIPGLGDFWISPVVLTHAEDAASPNLAVVRMPTVVGDQEYSAVRFQYQDGDAEYVWMFDQESGLLLFHRYAIGDPLYEDSQAGQLTLLQRRRLSIPWRRDIKPDWVRTGVNLEYEGVYGTVPPASPRVDLPYGLTARITRAQRRWSEYEVTDYLYGVVNTRGSRVSGTAQLFDALWLPVSAAGRIRTGQVLDTDPVTGARIVVESKDAATVVLAEIGDAYRTALNYDAVDGRLLGISSQTQVGLATTLIDVQVVP
jgi:hypothetical protein